MTLMGVEQDLSGTSIVLYHLPPLLDAFIISIVLCGANQLITIICNLPWSRRTPYRRQGRAEIINVR